VTQRPRRADDSVPAPVAVSWLLTPEETGPRLLPQLGAAARSDRSFGSEAGTESLPYERYCSAPPGCQHGPSDPT
jgi:hypothetical protein